MEKPNRFLALDAFRGFTIIAMILVNTPGSWSYVYPPLQHADWHGCTPTDLVFPFFLFIVGVSMWYSFKKQGHQLTKNLSWKIIKRSFLIFAIGLFINAFPFVNLELSSLRIMGVLQRIALAFCLASFLCLLLNTKQLILVAAGVLLSYWGLLWGFVEETPYGLSENLVRQIDLKIFGATHLWQGKGIPFDPEGLLSTLPATANVILGYLTAQLILAREDRIVYSRLLRIVGLACIVVGFLWGMVFPINKSLWTSSYVLYTTGFALIFLYLFILLFKWKAFRERSDFLLVFGMNSLFAYTLSMLWVKLLYAIPWGETHAYDALYKLLVPFAGNMNGSLLFAVLHILFFGAILTVLYRRRIFIKV